METEGCVDHKIKKHNRRTPMKLKSDKEELIQKILVAAIGIFILIMLTLSIAYGDTLHIIMKEDGTIMFSNVPVKEKGSKDKMIGTREVNIPKYDCNEIYMNYQSAVTLKDRLIDECEIIGNDVAPECSQLIQAFKEMKTLEKRYALTECFVPLKEAKLYE